MKSLENRRLLVPLFALLLTACGEDENVAEQEVDNSPAVSDLASLRDGAPANESLPEDGKFDARYPATLDLMATMTPVRSQGSRGTCSIFATLALMEQLYRLEGSLVNPDFSEQFLQWSAKVEVGAYTDTDGSNPRQNVEAINRYGIVTEASYPYETRAWSTADDPRCTGEGRPTLCYTNGNPSESVLAERRWALPRGRYVNCADRSLKAYMTENRAGVVATVEFFYQSWNHGGSLLPVNRNSFRNGWVSGPNAADVTDSRLRPAGHAVLLLGWNDTLEVPRVDGQGNPVLDANGNPQVERGFWLFKNSWGTGSFGTANPFGAGYGWISMAYVREHGNCYSAGVPTAVRLDQEICDNGSDDNGNGRVDCDDPGCVTSSVCRPTGLRYENTTAAPIPDNTPGGVTSSISVPATGSVATVEVSIDITHTYQGDLQVELVAPDGRTAPLHSRTGGSTDNLVLTTTVSSLAGSPVSGTWSLRVADGAAEDTGTLNGWSLAFTLGGEVPVEVCDDGVDNNANGDTDCADEACLEAESCATAESARFEESVAQAIPDNSASGISSIIEVNTAGTIETLRVDVNISHSYSGDLRVVLENEAGTTVVLYNKEGGSQDNLVRTFTPVAFNGTLATGLWSLTVSDNGRLDVGTFNSWALEIVTASR